jgi:hypothetical protein
MNSKPINEESEDRADLNMAGSGASGEDASSTPPTPGGAAAGHSGPAHTSTVFNRRGGLGSEHGLVASADTGSAPPRRRYRGAFEPGQIAARMRAGRLPLRQEKIDAYDERKSREAEAAAEANELAALVREDRRHAQAMMAAPGAPLLGNLHIEGRRRWSAEPRYANTGLSQREEDIRYFLETLPPEVEWTFWFADRNLIKAGDRLAPRSILPESLMLLHALAEENALSFADEAERWRKEDKAKRRRDRAKTIELSAFFWKWEDTVDGKGDLIEVFVPAGYSLWLWGRPRHQVAAPIHHLKRSECAERLEKLLAGRSIGEYLTEAAKETGCRSFKEFVAPLPGRRPTEVEKKRRAALAKALSDLWGAGATQKRLAEVTGLRQNQVSRLKSAHLQGKR